MDMCSGNVLLYVNNLVTVPSEKCLIVYFYFSRHIFWAIRTVNFGSCSHFHILQIQKHAIYSKQNSLFLQMTQNSLRQRERTRERKKYVARKITSAKTVPRKNVFRLSVHLCFCLFNLAEQYRLFCSLAELWLYWCWGEFRFGTGALFEHMENKKQIWKEELRERAVEGCVIMLAQESIGSSV